MIVLAGSGWIDPTRLEGMLRMAVTPLAVFWGFQEYAKRQESPPVERPDVGALWARTVRTVTHLAGMIAVVGILVLEAFPPGHFGTDRSHRSGAPVHMHGHH